jgi:hypothetical protein
MDINITGASDDLIEFDGVPDYDEFCNSGSSPIKFSGNLIAPDGSGVRVIVIYDSQGPESSGCWSVAVGKIDEDTDYPEWPTVVSKGDRDYNTLVTVEAPDGTILIPDENYRL